MERERDKYKDDASAAREAHKKDEIRYREALATSDSTTVAVQQSLTQSEKDKAAALKELEVSLTGLCSADHRL